MTKKTKSNVMWGGRFAQVPEQVMKSINASIKFDKRLYRHDILASVTHAEMLVNMGIINQTSGTKIVNGLQAIFCLLYTSPSPRDGLLSRMPSSA